MKVLVPEIVSPMDLVVALEDGLGRKVMCLVSIIVDLEEPPMILNFFGDLEASR